MIKQKLIESFLTQKTMVIVGASSKSKKFGNIVLKELSSKGYEIFLVHPTADKIDGFDCYASLAELPKEVSGLINVVPPVQTEMMVREANASGIKKIWMQQGSDSPDAIRYCTEHNMDVIHGECILMFAQPRGLHKFHHWLRGLFGKLPRDHNNLE